MIWFPVMLSAVGLVTVLTPIVWMFLKLAGKIGPEDPEAAGALGIVLFVFCWLGATGVFAGAASILHISFR